MTAPSRQSTGSVAPHAAPGESPPEALRVALQVAREWAGGDLVALLLSGSHATGEGVWLESGARTVTLSDVDVYAVLSDASACRAARERARRDRSAARARLREAGLEAPLEVGFLTLEGLARLPAKPGTLELALHGVAVAGDASALERVPRPAPGEIPAEEALLLLENRAFELLVAWPGLAAGEPLERAHARHGTLKAVADLATVLALRAGELPDGTAARIAWARPRLADSLAARLSPEWIDTPPELERLWEAALAWRRGEVHAPAPAEAAHDWRGAVRAWCAVWDGCFPGPGAEPWERVRRAAARAPLPRRLRRNLGDPEPGSPWRRLRRAFAGTPQHRVNASAAVLLLSAAAGRSAPALPAGGLRALRALGVSGAGTWEEARRDVVRAWDAVVLGGQRGTEAA